MLKLIKNNAGDTIVEVMVVLAVLGLAIGISYATASRSLTNTRSSQENSSATELLKSQVEVLRYWAADLNYGALPPSFCVNPAASSVGSVVVTGASCKNLDTYYTVDISYQDTGTNPNTFTLIATWQDLQQKGYKDSATLVYRVHQ